MEIKRKYLQKYLHQIATDQIVDEYRERQYIVSTEEKIGNVETDIIARNASETIIIEIKTGRLTQQKKESIAKLADIVRKYESYKFLVVVATPPKVKELVVDGIEDILTLHFMQEMPDELDQLSTHTRIESISDVDLDEILIKGQYVHVKGDAVFDIKIQFGSDGDQSSGDGFESSDTIPFDFEITLKYDEHLRLTISEISDLKIDTSSYYGNS